MSSNLFDRLSDELVLGVFEHAHVDDILNCGRVCRQFRDLSCDNVLWRRLYARDFTFENGRRLENTISEYSARGEDDVPVQRKKDWAKEYRLNWQWQQGRCWTRKKQIGFEGPPHGNLPCMDTYRGFTFIVYEIRDMSPSVWKLQVRHLGQDTIIAELAAQGDGAIQGERKVEVERIGIDKYHSSDRVIRVVLGHVRNSSGFPFSFYEFDIVQNALQFVSFYVSLEAESMSDNTYTIPIHYCHPYFGFIQHSGFHSVEPHPKEFRIDLKIWTGEEWVHFANIAAELASEITYHAPRLNVRYTDDEVIATMVSLRDPSNRDPIPIMVREYRFSKGGCLLKMSDSEEDYGVTSWPDGSMIFRLRYNHPYVVLQCEPLVIFKVESSTRSLPLQVKLIGVVFEDVPWYPSKLRIPNVYNLSFDLKGRLVTVGLRGSRVRFYDFANSRVIKTPYCANPIPRLNGQYLRYKDGIDVAQDEDETQREEVRRGDPSISLFDKKAGMYFRHTKERGHDPRDLLDVKLDDERITLLSKVDSTYYLQILEFDKKRGSDKISGTDWQDYWELSSETRQMLAKSMEEISTEAAEIDSGQIEKNSSRKKKWWKMRRR